MSLKAAVIQLFWEYTAMGTVTDLPVSVTGMAVATVVLPLDVRSWSVLPSHCVALTGLELTM